MIGYFEGLGSERGIAWRVADSLALRRFLGYRLSASPPEHSSLSRIRGRLPVEVHQAVFDWVLKVLVDHDLLKGKTVAVDATTLEANAAMRSIVRRDTGKAYHEYLEGLARADRCVVPMKGTPRRWPRVWTRPIAICKRFLSRRRRRSAKW